MRNQKYPKRKENIMLAVGTKAPDFTLPDQNGELRKLSDLFLPEGYDAGLHQAGLRLCGALPAVP